MLYVVDEYVGNDGSMFQFRGLVLYSPCSLSSRRKIREVVLACVFRRFDYKLIVTRQSGILLRPVNCAVTTSFVERLAMLKQIQQSGR